MNIFSAFDGMSCGQIALNNLGVKYDNYFASEIDNQAIRVTQSNFPKTIQVGDIAKVDCSKLPKIDLLFGGSPCQGFSFAGKQLNFDDPRSKLFFEFVRLKNELTPSVFLLENVFMKKAYQDLISDILECEPIKINSSLVSAQNRERLYWTNLKFSTPSVSKVYLRDILETVNEDFKPLSDKPMPLRNIYPKNGQNGYIYSCYGKSKTLSAGIGLTGNGIGSSNAPKIHCDASKDNWRRMTALECERLQTVPDNYTKFVSDTQRYKMLGNGWTVKIIEHFFCNLNKSAKVHQRPMSLFSNFG